MITLERKNKKESYISVSEVIEFWSHSNMPLNSEDFSTESSLKTEWKQPQYLGEESPTWDVHVESSRYGVRGM